MKTMTNDPRSPKSRGSALTKRRAAKASSESKGSADPFRALIDISADPAIIISPRGATSYINLAFTQVFGYSLDDIPDRNLFLLIHPNDLPLVQAHFATIQRPGNAGQAVEIQLRHNAGSYRTVEIVGTALLDGTLGGYLRDLTEHKRAEQLQASEEQFRSLIENSSDGIMIFDRQGVFGYVSPGLTRIVGWEASELLGQMWHAFAHPDDLGRTRESFHLVFEQPGQAIAHESRFRHKDGSWRVMEVVAKLHPNGRVVANSRDITERKRAEEKLRESEDYYRTILETATDGISLTDAGGIFTYVNPAYAEMLGYAPQELIGQPYLPLLHPNEVDASIQAFAEAVANPGRRLEPIQARLRRKDGSWCVIETTGGFLGSGIVASSRDITAQKEAEDQLRRLNEKLEQRVAERTAQLEAAFAERTRLAEILEATSDMVAFATLDGKPLYVNHAGRRMVGIPDGLDVTRLTFEDMYPPEVLETFAAVGIPTAMRDGTWSGEVTLKHRDGQLIPVSIVGIIHFQPDGAPTHLSAIIRDISRQKQVEAELRHAKEAAEQALAESRRLAAIIEATSDYVGIADLQGQMRYLNQAGRVMVGVAAQDDIHAYHMADFLSSQVLTMMEAWIAENLAKQNDVDLLEAALQHLDGQEIPASIVGIIHRDASGIPESLSAVIRDISEQKRAEAELKQAKEAAEAANKAKSTFLANMSHEIRTPMNAVIGMTSLLLNTPLDDKQRDFVETIRTSGDALLTIINDILDFSKIEAGKLDLERQPLDLRSCIEAALDLLAPHAVEKGIDLVYELSEDVPGGIVGDVTRLRQILVNLLSNAIKFTEHGEVVVSVSTTNHRPPTTDAVGSVVSGRSSVVDLHFSVKDTGIGIPPDKIDRLFQSFSQIDASTTRQFGGTGLGLAISKRLAELMGGTMWAESAGAGQGTTFSFTVRAPAAPAPVRSHLHSRQPLLTGKRLLVVDDHPTNRRILSLQAQTWGMECVAAASPQAALALLRQGERFDLAVLDMHMPEMDGGALAVALCEEHSQQGWHFPLILLTSLGYETRPELDTVECFAAYLTKPVKPSQLYDVLIGVLAGEDRAAHRSLERAPAITDRALLAERLPLRILLAEDVAVNQKFALFALEELGYSADVAANGREVLAALQRQPYDVILMDVQMPELDGLEATRRIRRVFGAGRQPHIIAMTANAMQGDRELCLEAGMDDYVSKPVYLDELRAALERANQRAITIETVLIDSLVVRRVLGQRMGRDLIELYLAEAGQLLRELAAAVARGEATEAQRITHGLKSSSRYAGAVAIAKRSEELETIARDSGLVRVPPLVVELQELFDRTRDQLVSLMAD
jgi:PAS domain S-box-containing protein